jgi:predicted PurR-regulated permease PerM
MSANIRTAAVDIASYILTGLALLAVLHLNLLAALFSGLLVYSLVHLMTPALGQQISSDRARMIAVAALSVVIVAFWSFAIWAGISFFRSDIGHMQALLQKMADILESSREQMPDWVQQHLPDNALALKELITAWLREHALEAKNLGEATGRTLAHLLIGMIIGAMVALYDSTRPRVYRPLGAALHQRAVNLHDSFRQVVFAQVRISAINTVFTATYLFVILPLCGVRLPLSKTMTAITFFAGLLPVIGNLISNSVLVVVGLSHSLQIALVSLAFLVVIHKLEYFLNARIIGSHINARAWELLVAMLVMESVFGLPGVVAAPVFYAYIKRELGERGLV